jgi:hypothetical protein
MALMTALLQEPCLPKKVNTKRIEGVLSDMRDQASSIIGHLVTVGDEQREMIELSREKIKLCEESLELNRKNEVIGSA